MSVLLAIDKFKGSLSQSELSDLIASYLQSIGVESDSIMVADGGDGSVAALISQGWVRRTLDVMGPLTTRHSANYAVSVDHKRVAIELAELCGIAYLRGQLAPYQASSYAIGEAITQIKPTDYEELIICLGGSASVDGGAGLLQALGVGITNRRGEKIKPGLEGLIDARNVDRFSLEQAREKYLGACKVRVLSDTEAPLTGFKGAAFSFGRQKGLSSLGVFRAELALRKWRRISSGVSQLRSTSSAKLGSAGGLGFTLQTLLGAEIESGSQFFLRESKFLEKLERASIVVTGEGRIDKTSLTGKSIHPILDLARNHNKSVILICGGADNSTLRILQKDYPIIEIIRLSDQNKPLHVLIRDAKVLLIEALRKVPYERWSR